jgi:nitroimidazol reductase NimA-like FMN-containing flavoprotein (pyridoxamine 5'-phosphate oxidase superfamily)
MPGLTNDELHEFLEEPGHLLRLGTVDRSGLPRVVPVWFVFDDGKLWFTPRAKSAWLDDLRADRGVCCTIDENTGAMRKLVARGRASLEHDLGDDDVWRARYRTIACRYTPPEFADAYIQDTIDEPRALYSLTLADAETATWRMPVRLGENPLAVWASHYYHR